MFWTWLREGLRVCVAGTCNYDEAVHKPVWESELLQQHPHACFVADAYNDDNGSVSQGIANW